MNILIVGGGRMGEAFAKSLLKSGFSDISVAEPDIVRKNYLINSLNIRTSNKDSINEQLKELVPDSDILIICVKPQIFSSLSELLSPHLNEKVIIISILAGINLTKICKLLGVKNAIRVMPNTPSQIGKGVSVWTSKESLSEKIESEVTKILDCLGISIKTSNESDLDRATAISGSGPGYIFLIMEILENVAIEIGLSKKVSRKLILETFQGSTELAKITKKDFKELREEVTSPNGTTEAGIREMKKNKFDFAIKFGIIKAYKRSIEISDD